jgi:hypothetical protein
MRTCSDVVTSDVQSLSLGNEVPAFVFGHQRETVLMKLRKRGNSDDR